MRIIHSIEIKDQAHIGAARRAVHRFANSIGFTETKLAELDIVVQEIGTNAVCYATDGGWLHFTTVLGEEPGIELFYWDKGPGIYDLDRAVRDGVSTSGGLGTGLGAIGRLMDEFEAYSKVRTAERTSGYTARYTTYGTALLGRKWTGHSRSMSNFHARMTKRIGAWSRPIHGENVNGDAYFVRQQAARTLLAVIDGLGHGRGAQAAAQVALNTLEEWKGEPLDQIFWGTHEALRATRGAVMGAAIVDHARESFCYAGVGNTEVRVFNAPERIHLIPDNGTLGSRFNKVRVWQHRWSEGATVVMTTDGLSAAWDIAEYPNLLNKSPQLIAGILMRDYSRDSDDATVLVAR